MENFIVSARKYRPATFNTVVGQDVITVTLKNAIKNNQLAQAFLFCGPRGVGKTTCARILAKTINCENVTSEIEPCNECKSCLSFNNSASFNVHELDAASNNSVDDIRNLVDQVRIPPQAGRYKVYIIDEVHMLSSSAFNAFLKTLEEPPPYAKFILATTEKHKILPTILSRCQIYDFKRISVPDTASHLAYVAEKEGVTADAEALHIIAQKSDGALRDALSIFDQIVSFSGHEITYLNVINNLNVLDYDYYFRITDAVVKGDISQTLLTVNEIIDNGFDGQHFLSGFGEHIRNLLVCKNKDTLGLLETGESLKKRYSEQTRGCSVPFLLKTLEILNQCDIHFKSSSNRNLLLEISLLQICGLAGVSKQVTAAEVKEESPPYRASEKKTISAPAQPVKPPVKAAVTPAADTTPRTASIRIRKEEDKKDVHCGEAGRDTPKPEKPFTQSDLEQAWLAFAEKVKDDPVLYTMLTRRNPLLESGARVAFLVDNKLLAEELRKKSPEMLSFLGERLENFAITIEPEVVKDIQNLRPYTSQDKFGKLASKNPQLNRFREDLNLELDY